MKKMMKILAFVLTLSMMFSSVAYAAEEDTVDASKSQYYGIDLDDLIVESGYTVVDSSEISRGPAAPLTNFILGAVYSENQPTGEIIQYSSSFYPTSTTLDHGGSWLAVITIEVGYAGQRYAYFNNTLMTLEDIQGFDSDGDSIIDGYYCLWGYENNFISGTFRANSTSVNYPWNTMYISNFTIL